MRRNPSSNEFENPHIYDYDTTENTFRAYCKSIAGTAKVLATLLARSDDPEAAHDNIGTNFRIDVRSALKDLAKNVDHASRLGVHGLVGSALVSSMEDDWRRASDQLEHANDIVSIRRLYYRP